MKGSRNRKVWFCRACNRKLYSWRAWGAHIWDAHKIAVPRKVRHVSERTAYEQTIRPPIGDTPASSSSE